jgi:hypothetical protein
MRDLLAGTREKLGPAPRVIRRVRRACFPQCLLNRPYDELFAAQKDFLFLLREGQPKLSVAFMWNRRLGELSNEPAVALVIHSKSPEKKMICGTFPAREPNFPS